MNNSFDTIIILDFGSQYTQLIARRIREQGVFAEILSCETDLDIVREKKPAGIILSGGPSSIYDEHAPTISDEVFNLGVPVLGICYGLQLMASLLGGEVKSTGVSEYGRKPIDVSNSTDTLFHGIASSSETWMSHQDQVTNLPEGFSVEASSDSCPIAAVANEQAKLYGLQFHPEVRHTAQGTEILKNFLFRICGAKSGWSMEAFVDWACERIRKQAGDSTVIGGVSGGVDSSVMAALMNKAIGKQFIGIFVDNGLLRKNEREQVATTLRDKLGVRLEVVDASSQFLSALSGIEDPEQKRKKIGYTFIEVFEAEARKYSDASFLAQGTLYPDVIESVSFKGPSATIKSHHNVGGLPEKMNLSLIEPLRELFKDEVRELGRQLGLSEEIVERHPFPGPGLAVRILGEVTEERLRLVREADAIFIEELVKSGWYKRVSQALAVLLPVKSVGVMGDARTYEHVAALRSVDTWDFMTADFSPLPHDLLGRVSTRIINEVSGINRVVYDISSKPPATVEWE